MANVCCVYGCPGAVPHPEDTDKCNAVSFHFPIDDPRRLAEWCERLQIGADCELCDLYICQRHFSPEQYDLVADCKNRLKVGAVPDRNLPKIKRETQPKETTSAEETKPYTFQRGFVGEGFNPPVLMVDDLGKACRLCLEADEQGTHESIFTKQDIAEYIVQSIGIGIEPNDGYPQMICQTCIERVTYIHRSREWFHKNDQFLKALVGELSNEKALPTEEPIGGEEGNAILPDEGMVKEECDLELVTEANIFESGSIEGEEVTLNQIAGAADFNESSDDERHERKRRRGLRTRGSDGEVVNIPQASLDLFCSSQKTTHRRFRCHCGASYLKEARLNTHILKEHEGRGLTKVIRPKVPANPLVLEEMAAVFNRIKTQGVAVELRDEINEIEDD
ncbi:uncharacterized protein LOC135697252 [Ochlerotatus camptorhynchus]|uniref:uncharacterized protein LOC135697252 n=1 Tax=Ochlerotatus camptorhynchus TaxID=644619 RepID=UPI0031DD6FBF